MNELLGLAGFAFVGSITPGPNNALLPASGIRFGFGRTVRHVAGTALGMSALILAMAGAIGFANPKGWLFAVAAVGTFLPRDLAPMPGALVVAATSAAIILATATVWAGGGAALSRMVDGGRTQRAVNLALALLPAAAVAFIWV